jgi:hypothetical protein
LNVVQHLRGCFYAVRNLRILIGRKRERTERNNHTKQQELFHGSSPHKIFWDLLLWIVNEPRPCVSGTLDQEASPLEEIKFQKRMEFWKTKKSGLKAVTLIATLNPVSQVLW